MGFDVCLLPEEEIYDFYKTYKIIENTISKKQIITVQDNIELKDCRSSLQSIEKYSLIKRSQGNNFSPASLFTKMGINPILIIRFYPGSESYKKFGESIHVDIRFTQHDLASIIKCLIANKPKTAGALKFKFAFGSVYEKLCSSDIYGAY
jgi:hypothetical protein